jgi:chromosome segregation ATPase
MKKIIFILLFLCISRLASGEVYKWVDEKGVAHFTDDITQIPEKCRPQTETLEYSEEALGTKTENESPSQKTTEETQPGGEDYRDSAGRGEGYWRERVEEWSKKLNEAQDKVGELRVRYNELTEKFNSSKSSVERANIRKERDQIQKEMELLKNQIEEAKQMLEKKIPEEAEIFKAKQEWIRQKP